MNEKLDWDWSKIDPFIDREELDPKLGLSRQEFTDACDNQEVKPN